MTSLPSTYRKPSRRTFLVAAVAATLLVTALSACTVIGRRPSAPRSPSSPAIEVTAPPQPLPSSEVTSYRGAQLSSVREFRENSIRGPQQVDRKAYRLKVSGLVDRPYELTYDELVARRPAFLKMVTLDCVEGWSVSILWEGVRVKDLLAAAGPRKEGQVVIFRAHDGYSTSLPREYLESRDIMLAYRQNGIELAPERGFPLQLVAEDKWGYKWIKWVESVELSADTGFRGYWESRGYSNGGDRDKAFLGR